MTPETTKITFQLETYVPPGKTDREVVEWVQKFFDYYHPTLEAKVIYQNAPVKGAEPVKPSTKMRK